MKVWSAVLVALAGACDGRHASTEPRGSREPWRVERHLGEIERWEQDVQWLAGEATDIVARYEAATGDLRVVEATSAEAIERAAVASRSLLEARQGWEAAQRRWALYQVLVQVAATLDATGIDRSRALAARPSGVPDCADGMSVAAYRAALIALGADLLGKDIDHIVPRALGGADHPANYRVISSSLNRSLGSSWGADKCASVGERCRGAVAVSRRCGSYAGPSF